MLLKDIKPIHLQLYFNSMTNLSTWSMKKTLYLLNSSFKYAIQNNYLRMNPLDGFKLPNSTKDEKTIEVFTVDEQMRYISALKTEKYGLLFNLAINTGMRLGEIIGLKWEYINFEQNTISIAETITRSKVYKNDGSYTKEIVTKKPKTKKSTRTIPIPSFLVVPLKSEKLKSTSQYVFTTKNNTPFSAEHVRRKHIKICQKANVKEISFHALRHTYATRLIELGENIKTVQELLGHADISTTMNIYTHISDETKKIASDKLNLLYEDMFK